jgi:hypothetical protein
MRRVRATVSGLVVVGAIGAFAPAAGAATPTPVPGTPSCQGQIVATYNHESGANEQSSGGPGKFLHQETHTEIQAVRGFECGAG